MTARSLLVAALVVVMLATAAATVPATAHAASGEVCVFRAAVLDTPRGLVIGYLHQDARVKLLGHTKNRRWYRISGPLRLVGWMKARHLCR
jgi:hypothetical protein